MAIIESNTLSNIAAGWFQVIRSSCKNPMPNHWPNKFFKFSLSPLSFASDLASFDTVTISYKKLSLKVRQR